MVEQNRFFVWVYRAFALLGLSILLLIGYVVVSEFTRSASWRDRHTVSVPAAAGTADAPTIRMRIGRVSRIKGAGVKMIEMMEAGYGRVGSRKFSSMGYDDHARNLIFVVDGQPKARWLFEKNTQTLRSIEEICACDDREAAARRTAAIFLQVVRTDSDGDGEIGGGDRSIPALLRPDGSGYTELSAAVEDVVDTSLSEDGERFGLLVVDAGKLLYREYGIADFALRSEQTLTELR